VGGAVINAVLAVQAPEKCDVSNATEPEKSANECSCLIRMNANAKIQTRNRSKRMNAISMNNRKNTLVVPSHRKRVTPRHQRRETVTASIAATASRRTAPANGCSTLAENCRHALLRFTKRNVIAFT
jgi:hypothetical protein